MAAEKKIEEMEFSMGSVATETRPVIVTKSGEAMTEIEGILLILNKLDKIEKTLG